MGRVRAPIRDTETSPVLGWGERSHYVAGFCELGQRLSYNSEFNSPVDKNGDIPNLSLISFAPPFSVS
jgi:hypothetical protein